MAKETLTSITPAYQVKKTVEVEPEETQRSVSYQAPTPEMQEYIREHIIKPTAQAYGVNPDTGEVTPFQALGYNPEDERKRREAEMALNDRKRKENAWYNAFAVVGDSLTAALGGNVWQRQPNNIGARANADNQRLIAEQKAEDDANAVKLRNSGVAYATAVNNLIQNYLTKTTTTNKTGGSRTETTDHPQVVSTRQVLDMTLGDRNNSNSYYRNGKYRYGVNDDGTVDVGLRDKNGKVQFRKISQEEADKLIEIARKAYGDALGGDDFEVSKRIRKYLGPSIIQQTSNGKYEWNDENLLKSGFLFDISGKNSNIDRPIRDYYGRITGEDYSDTGFARRLLSPVEQALQNARENKPASSSGARIDPTTGKPKEPYYANYGTR